MLRDHEQALQEDAVARSQKDEEKAKKADKATKRKSAIIEETNDVEMEDAGDDDAVAPVKKTKGTKKRKKDDDSDGEPEKVSLL